MKKFLFAVTFLFCQSVNAQDTIIKNNGDHILSKVTEITASEIKYKKFNYLEGPTYVEKKSNVQLVKYSDGTKLEFRTGNGIVAQKRNDSLKSADQGIIDDYYGDPERGHLTIDGSIFMRDDVEITEEEFYGWLLRTKNEEIMGLAERSRLAKKKQKINSVCIPIGIALIVFPPAFLIAEPIFIYNYFKYRKIHKTTNKRAVELYNQA